MTEKQLRERMRQLIEAIKTDDWESFRRLSHDDIILALDPHNRITIRIRDDRHIITIPNAD